MTISVTAETNTVHKTRRTGFKVFKGQVPFTEEALGRLFRAAVLSGGSLSVDSYTAEYQDTQNNRWRDHVEFSIVLDPDLKESFESLAQTTV